MLSERMNLQGGLELVSDERRERDIFRVLNTSISIVTNRRPNQLVLVKEI